MAIGAKDELDGAEDVAGAAAWRLPALPMRLNPLARIGWMLLAVMALATIIGGSWRGYVQSLQIDPSWNRLGLYTDYPETGGFRIYWLTEEIEKAGVVDESVLLAVDGRRVAADASEEAASRMVRGADGTVRLTLRAPDGTVGTATLRRHAGAAGDSSVISDEAFFVISSGAGMVAALILVAAAALLARRRFRDPVSLLLSIALLLMVIGLPVGEWWWMWLDATWVSALAGPLALAAFMVALPAFPDGRYRPAAGRWLALAAVPVAAAVALLQDQAPGIVLTAAILAALAAGLFPLLRFRRTPRGLERQQLKWVGAGFFGAVVTLGFSALAIAAGETIPMPVVAASWLRMVGIAMQQAALILLPLGLLVSLLRFRLWDADAVIGRSAGWAILTLTAGAVWAASTAIIDEAIKGTVGDTNQGLAAAASTVFAVLVLAPAHERIVGWMDARFRANIVRLRDLPQRLQIWQHGDTPEDIGARVVEAACRCLHTECAAMLLHAGESYRIVGRRGVAAAALDDWIAAHMADGRLATDRVERADGLFPLRLVLEDGGVAIGALLLGRRSDGSPYAKDERAALDALETPLAAALRQAQRRRASEARTAALIAEIEARLRGLERDQAA